MPEYPFTAESIASLRDGSGLSWAKVAQGLKLGSPGAARRAYSALVRPHTESVLPGRTTTGKGVQPVAFTDDTTVDELREALVGRTIVLQRADRTEDITVAKVTSIKAGTVNFNDGAKARSVKVGAIVAVK
jgi:hypothetical protein